jgi:hypothetical protein
LFTDQTLFVPNFFATKKNIHLFQKKKKKKKKEKERKKEEKKFTILFSLANHSNIAGTVSV